MERDIDIADDFHRTDGLSGTFAPAISRDDPWSRTDESASITDPESIRAVPGRDLEALASVTHGPR